ncbi:MAG: DUF2141 domain-containing protein [Cyanobacteria bacterium J06634_5]
MHLSLVRHSQLHRYATGLAVAAALPISLALATGQGAANAQLLTNSELTVEISNIENAEGQICVSLFSSSAGFPNDETDIVGKQCVAAIETAPLEDHATAGSDALETGETEEVDETEEISGPGKISGLADVGKTSPSADILAASEAMLEAQPAETSISAPIQVPISTPISVIEASERSQDVLITEAVLIVTFADIEPGTYAVSVMHDENTDGTLNTGIFGIPTEGFGFSQNPEIGTSAPEFSEAAIVVVGRETTTQVKLIYY